VGEVDELDAVGGSHRSVSISLIRADLRQRWRHPVKRSRFLLFVAVVAFWPH